MPFGYYKLHLASRFPTFQTYDSVEYVESFYS